MTDMNHTVVALLEAAMHADTEMFEAIVEEMDTPSIVGVQTYRQAGVLTLDDGVVVDLDDGQEFQITVTQSRSA